MSFKEQGPFIFEELDKRVPEPFRPMIQSLIFFYSDFNHDQKLKDLYTGIVMFVGSTPATNLSK